MVVFRSPSLAKWPIVATRQPPRRVETFASAPTARELFHIVDEGWAREGDEAILNIDAVWLKHVEIIV